MNPYLLTALNTPKLAYFYAKELLRVRWPETEPVSIIEPKYTVTFTNERPEEYDCSAVMLVDINLYFDGEYIGMGVVGKNLTQRFSSPDIIYTSLGIQPEIEGLSCLSPEMRLALYDILKPAYLDWVPVTKPTPAMLGYVLQRSPFISNLDFAPEVECSIGMGKLNWGGVSLPVLAIIGQKGVYTELEALVEKLVLKISSNNKEKLVRKITSRIEYLMKNAGVIPF